MTKKVVSTHKTEDAAIGAMNFLLKNGIDAEVKQTADGKWAVWGNGKLVTQKIVVFFED